MTLQLGLAAICTPVNLAVHACGRQISSMPDQQLHIVEAPQTCRHMKGAAGNAAEAEPFEGLLSLWRGYRGPIEGIAHGVVPIEACTVVCSTNLGTMGQQHLQAQGARVGTKS